MSSGKGVLDIDPSNGHVTTLSSLKFTGITDGLTFTPDGKYLYAAVGGNRVEGVDMATGSLIFNVGISGADGTALGTGTLTGNIFVNNNDGTFYEISLSTGDKTLLAQGGSRGDFVTVDPNNGTLLITQTDRIYRLTAPVGGGFGVPEPSSIVMAMIAASTGLACFRRRHRKST